MRKITAYETTDGEKHTTLGEARGHQEYLIRKGLKDVMEEFSGVTPDTATLHNIHKRVLTAPTKTAQKLDILSRLIWDSLEEPE